MDKVLIVIPARYGSTRFPGKALADLGGKPLIVRVAERAAAVTRAQGVVVATDDSRIMAAVAAAGLDCVMTGEHASGSDRVGEAVAGTDAEIIVNLQGDEPLFDPADIDRLIEMMTGDSGVDIGTLAHPFADEDAWLDPNAVKVLADRDGRALIFTRAPVPARFPGRDAQPWRLAKRHVGIYVYRRSALQAFLNQPPSAWEMCEGLEQLRALAMGLRIQVLETLTQAVGVDTPEDLRKIRGIPEK